jgi:hypothetical protein
LTRRRVLQKGKRCHSTFLKKLNDTFFLFAFSVFAPCPGSDSWFRGARPSSKESGIDHVGDGLALGRAILEMGKKVSFNFSQEKVE